MADINPASLQVIEVLQQMRKYLGPASNKVRKSYETVASSIDRLNKVLTKSKIFKPVQLKLMTNFFKKAPIQIKKIDKSLHSFSTNITKTTKAIEDLKMAQTEAPQARPMETMMTIPPELIEQIQTLNLNLLGLKTEVEDLEANDIRLSSESVTELRDVREEVLGLQDSLRGMTNDIQDAGRDANIAAGQFGHFTEEISDSTNEMNLLGRETKVTSTQFASVLNRVSDVNNRLFHTRKRMDNINKEMLENVEHHEVLGESLNKTSNIMLGLAGLNILGGVRTEATQEQITSLSDELIDFQKRAGFANNEMDNWRKTAINTADALWKVRKVATTPAEVVDAYTKLREAGVRSEKQIKELVDVIIAADRAIGLTKEESTEFANAMIEGTNISAKGVGNILSAFTRLRKFSKLSAKDMIEGAKDIDKEFSFVLTKLSDRGKQTFITTLVSAMGAFKEAGVENTDLINKMAVALKSPQEAAQIFGKILVGTGYDVIQMQRDLIRGAPSKAIYAVLEGLRNTRKMSGVELEAFLQDTGLALEDIDRLITNSSKIRQSFQMGVTETTRELRNQQRTLYEDAAKENQKLGKTFEILGNRIKTWLAKVGVGALGSLGLSMGDILDRAPEILILVTAIGKLKGAFGGLGSIAGKIGGQGGAFPILGTALSSIAGGIQAIGVAILPVLGPVLLLAGAVASLWAAFKLGPKIMDWLKETFPEWGKGVDLLWGKLNKFINWFEDKFPTVFGVVRDVLMSIGGAIKDLVLHPIETVKKAFTNIKKFFGFGKESIADYEKLNEARMKEREAKEIALKRAELRTRAEKAEVQAAKQQVITLRESKSTTWGQLAKAEEALRMAKEKERKAFETALTNIQTDRRKEIAVPEIPMVANPLVQSPTAVEQAVEKVIAPEPPKKIFAEKREIISSPDVNVDVHQKDVVNALQKLGDRIEKAVQNNRQEQAMRIGGFRGTPDEQAELNRQWRR